MSILSRFLIALSAVFIMHASAQAQSTILVVDQGKIMRDSEVGKSITRQLESIAKTMESELKSSAAPIESQAKSLMSELQGMDQSALKSRPDLKTRAMDIRKKEYKQQGEMAIKARELKITEAKAYQKVNEKLATILEQIVKERNADVVLDRSLVIYGQPADVTDVVMSRLNSQMTSVAVTRERLPRQ